MLCSVYVFIMKQKEFLDASGNINSLIYHTNTDTNFIETIKRNRFEFYKYLLHVAYEYARELSNYTLHSILLGISSREHIEQHAKPNKMTWHQ